MKPENSCNCKCHTLKSEDMIKPVKIESLCNCNCNCHKPKDPKDGTFIEHNNTSFSAKGTVAYGEEADADDL